MIDLQRGEADEVAKAARGVFETSKGKLILVVMILMSKFVDVCGCLTRYIPWLLILSATLPFLKPLLNDFVLNYTNAVEPWKVLYHTSLKLIEARRSGSAKQAKVSFMVNNACDILVLYSSRTCCN